MMFMTSDIAGPLRRLSTMAKIRTDALGEQRAL
jgi:hypothetical protein